MTIPVLLSFTCTFASSKSPVDLTFTNIFLSNSIKLLLALNSSASFFDKKEKLNVTLISGVNGVGKTTSIGKIGKILKQNHNDVLFAACDTFRAAAIDQLEKWSEKIGAKIIKSNPGSDPASVAFKAIEESKNKNKWQMRY